MNDQNVSHPAPHRERVSLRALMFGCCAAPIFWVGQELLGYGFSATVCYSGYHPTPEGGTPGLWYILACFDAIALVVALAGGVVSWRSWLKVRDEKEGGAAQAMEIGDGRARFMAIWGLISSLWFLSAIIFTSIANLGAVACAT